MGRLIVDGMNVIGSRPDGWWRDRDGAVRALLARLQRLHARSGDAVRMVLDGRPLPDIGEGEHGGVDVRYAERRGANAADDHIVELLAAEDHPEQFQVVTADRALRERIHALGAATLGPVAFLRRLDQLDPHD